jgi:uncharacterized membrane protein/mono/diheme cytochrome c family protein
MHSFMLSTLLQKCSDTFSRVKFKLISFILLVALSCVCSFVYAENASESPPEVTTAEVVIEQADADEVEGVEGVDATPYSIIPFLGRLHPMILHFPIALLVLTLLFEIGALFKSSKGYQVAIWITLGLANVMLLKTIWFGWILAEESGYGGDTLFWHRWLGVAVGCLAFIAIVLKFLATRKETLSARNQYRFVLLITVVMLMFGSHFGSNMSHGSTFITEKMPPALKAFLLDDSGAEDMVKEGLFSNTIWPILEKHCTECHGEEKQEGDFRVDQTTTLLSGGESGEPAVVPGDAMASRMVKLISLNSTHEEVMPPEGKGTLGSDEIVTLIRWINLGAPMGAGTTSVNALDIDVDSDNMVVAEAGEDQPTSPLWDALKDKESDVDFGKEIMPIFSESCVKCHGIKKQKGHLRLDSPQWLLAGADGENVLVPGKAAESLIYSLTILSEDDDDVMPSKGELLTKKQTDLIKKWIEGGAGFGGYRAAVVVNVKSVLEVLQEKLPPLTDEPSVTRLNQ